jgi:type II secretory pathway component PulL
MHVCLCAWVFVYARLCVCECVCVCMCVLARACVHSRTWECYTVATNKGLILVTDKSLLQDKELSQWPLPTCTPKPEVVVPLWTDATFPLIDTTSHHLLQQTTGQQRKSCILDGAPMLRQQITQIEGMWLAWRVVTTCHVLWLTSPARGKKFICLIFTSCPCLASNQPCSGGKEWSSHPEQLLVALDPGGSGELMKNT